MLKDAVRLLFNSVMFVELPIYLREKIFNLSGIESTVHLMAKLEPLGISACGELIDVPLGSVSEILGGEKAPGNKQTKKD